MCVKQFSKEEMAALSKSPYVLRISEKSISFTRDFLKEYRELRLNGMKKREALAKFDLDIDVIGYSRMRGIDYRVMRNARLETDSLFAEAGRSIAELMLQMQNRLTNIQQRYEVYQRLLEIRESGSGGRKILTDKDYYQAIWEAVHKSNNVLQVENLCEILKVSYSGYRLWVVAGVQAQSNNEDVKSIDIIKQEINPIAI
ncbi:MAG: hypothetical protein Q4D21_01625 [Phascolarctobacterium sp.]|nr:hypothetical protein [Phascolarctobacterium sp.]